MSEAQKPSPFTQHKRFAAMAEAAKLPRLLRAGTKAMREDGDWLPQSPGESPDTYALRQKRSFLLGKYSDVCDELGNTLFSGSVTIEAEGADPKAAKQPELSPEYKAWLEDFDRQGQTIEEWSLCAFQEALDAGVVHCLVEHPTIGLSENREEEIAKGARPYATMFRGDDVLQVKRSADGKRLERINLSLISTETVEWEERTTTRVLIVYAGDPTVADLSPGSARFARWEIQEKRKVDGAEAESDVVVANGSYRPHVEINLRSFYTRRVGFMVGRPPLRRLAEKNAEHWQSASHQRMNLDFSRFSMIFRKNFNDDERGQTKIGGSAMFDARSPEADMKVVESQGAALAAGRTHLEDCKAEMNDMALQPRLKMGATTAAEVMVEKGEADTQIGAWAIGFERFLQEILGLFAVWVAPAGGEPKRIGTVSIRIDDSVTMTPAQLEFVKYLVEKGYMSQKSTLRFGKESGLLPAWLDIEAEIAATKTEAPVLRGSPLPLPINQPPMPPNPPDPAKPDPKAAPSA